MKYGLSCLFILFFAVPVWSQINMTNLSQLDQHGTNYANIWGYTDSLGREYALLGCNTGTAVIEITNPSIPVERAFIPGGTSSWHEIQSWGKYAYVVSEAGGSGLQIIDMSQLPVTATLVNTWTTTGYDHTHDIQIRDGYAYLTGGNATPVGGIKILSLADPVNPVEVGSFNNEYIHDCYVRNDTIYAAAIFSGKVYVIDAKNKSNLQVVHSYTYPGAFTHNTALSDNGQILFTTDETSSPAGSLRIWDISTLRDGIANNTNISQLGSYGSSGIVHNVYAKGKYAYASYYTEGVRIFDVSNPSAPIVAGHYDTYTPSNSAQFAGAWGVYPYFPSGNIAVSDISGGLYVLGFSGKETGQISGIVTDSISGEPIKDVTITLLQDNLTRTTNDSGRYNFTALSGNSTLKIVKPGYVTIYRDATVPTNSASNFDYAMTRNLPQTPQHVTISHDSASLTLTWRQNQEPFFMRYRIYGGTSPNPVTVLDSLDNRQDTVITFSGLTNGTLYYFRLTVVDSSFRESVFSTEVSEAPNIPGFEPPETPANVTISSDSARVTLQWNQNQDGDFMRYRIYGGTSPGPTVSIDSVENRVDTIKTIAGLVNGTTYYFRITAVDNHYVESGFSAQVSATPQTPSLSLTTSLYQNSLLTKYVDIIVTSDVDLTGAPTVKLWRTTDTTVIAMSVISQNVYKGSYAFDADGIYKIRTRAVSYRGQDSTKERTYSVSLAKPGIPVVLKSADGLARLQILDNSVSEETCFILNNETIKNETAYYFGPTNEFSSTIRVEIQYDPARFAETDKLFIFRYEDGQWQRLESLVLPKYNKVVANVNKLGVFKVDEDYEMTAHNLVVKSYNLKQNYPNPFNPSTTIEYDMPEDGRLSIVVYNLLGQKVRTLYDAQRSAGRYTVIWDGRHDNGREAASGIYLYRLQTKNFIQTKRMLFIK
ncbi:choice-of-anchor B family protein [bacterium]|nr:choice-of-anchor B family protein [bacterium]